MIWRAPGLLVPLAVVALSGFCSLIYQVVWERMLRYSVGGDSVAAAIVTGTFLLGLGLGAFAFGRWRRSPFRWYATVEAGIGLYALVSVPVLTGLAETLGRVFHTPISAAEGLRPVVLVVSILFLLPPCILIGGTGPLMFNCFVRDSGYRARTIGLLYGTNTAGAALGVVAAPFFLLNRLSLPATLAVIGVTNLALALGIWRVGAGRPAEAALEVVGPTPAPASADARLRPAASWLLLGLAGASGLMSLAFEVTLVRALFVLNPSSPYNFPAVLIPFLLAIALGSASFTRLRGEDRPQILRRIGVLFVGGAVTSLVAVTISGSLSLAGVRPSACPATVIVHAALLAASLPLCLGAALPLALRLAAASGAQLPARTGPLYLANALGSFAGALLTQFVGFATIGTRGVLVSVFEMGLLAGGACLWRSGYLRVRPWVAALLVVAAMGPWAIPASVWGAYAWGMLAPGADVIEGVTGVTRIDWSGAGGEVFVNGQSMSRLPDHPRHVRLVAFALAQARRERVLLLGLGGGGMVKELVRDPAIGEVEVVDWSHELPLVLEGARARRLLDDALHSPKVTLRRSDARVAVGLYQAGVFDVVIDNLTIAHWVGATSVKSIEYFRQIRRILAPDGVFVYHGNYGGARRAILAGLTDTFPTVRLHPGTGPVDEVVLASTKPLEILPGHVATVLARLPPTGMRSASDLVGGLVPVRRDDLGRVQPVRDAVLHYEYHKDPVREIKRALRTLRRALGFR